MATSIHGMQQSLSLSESALVVSLWGNHRHDLFCEDGHSHRFLGHRSSSNCPDWLCCCVRSKGRDMWQIDLNCTNLSDLLVFTSVRFDCFDATNSSMVHSNPIQSQILPFHLRRFLWHLLSTNLFLSQWKSIYLVVRLYSERITSSEWVFERNPLKNFSHRCRHPCSRPIY